MKTSRLFLPVLLGALMGIPAAAQETWKPIGTGLFRENFLHAYYTIASYPEVSVEIQESEQTPGRYRIMNPYADYPNFIGSPGCYDGEWYITVDASDPERCYVERSKTGYMAGVDQMLIAGSLADEYLNVEGNPEKAEKVYGKLVDGAITFPPMAVLSGLWDTTEEWDDDIQFAVGDYEGKFRLKLPGAPDLDITADLIGLSTDGNEVNFNITLGKSVEKALVAMVPADEAEGAAAAVVAGTIASKEVTAGGVVGVPYTGDGRFTIVVVPYFEDTPRSAFTRTLEVSLSQREWRKAGKATYHEGIISAVEELIPYGFTFPSYTYEVDVEESTERPGYIRLVDAYGPACPLSSGNYFDDTRHWYIYIDASDPDAVVLERAQGVGLDMRFGVMEIWSKADRAVNHPAFPGYGYTEEQIRERNWYGLFANDKITFPKGSLSFMVPGINPGGWYEANSKGEFAIDFAPGQLKGGQSGIESVTVEGDNNTPAEYFRIDGTPVSGEALVPGIYIVRQGKNVTKTIIR
ncbi:MAG: hypothetical protein K2L80_00595 [Muribaculaceae bacterium]|nr:hypothetical protein [Muribaculaceae bacterium]